MNQSGEPCGLEHRQDAYFGLSEEVRNAINLPAESDEVEVGNYLQQLHIRNHAVTAKEIIHDISVVNEAIPETDHAFMDPEDELMFDQVMEAMTEKEVMDLRANLKSIAGSVSVHEFTFNEIEDFLTGELDNEVEKMIQAEAFENDDLAFEILMHQETEEAAGEMDIMNLRAGLRQMMHTEYSHSRSVEDIDGYIHDDLDEMEIADFEEELFANSGLKADLAFHKELDTALSETDVMALRNNLQQIARTEQNRSSEKLGISPPAKKKIYWYAAASVVVLLLAFATLLKQKEVNPDQLYASYYQPYAGPTFVARSAASPTSFLNKALKEIQNKNYPGALALLEKAKPEDQEGFAVNFYSGVAYQELGKYQMAINSFEAVVNQGDNLLIEQSEWYIGLCYLRTEERDKAISQFRSIVSRNGYYSNKSARLLKYLE
ncbi:MAG: hypothetical protein LWW85_05955 [Marinilabiliales bacterium]|nr:hypothetical protein [Marinilabiliales bacterium]